MTSALPSQIKSDYWVHAVNPNTANDWIERSGKWLIFVPEAALLLRISNEEEVLVFEFRFK